jgi:hypothetical protein
MKKLALLQQVIEMNTAEMNAVKSNASERNALCAQNKKGSVRKLIGSIIWWSGFTVVGWTVTLVNFSLALLASALVNPRTSTGYAHDVLGQIALQAVLITLAPIGVIVASKLSKQHRLRAAIVIATVGALFWLAFALMCGGAGFLPEATLPLWMYELTAACFALNAVAQILAARLIAKRAAAPVPA